MTEKVLEGVLVPVTTPFDAASGDVAEAALKANVRRLLEAGLDGIVVAGSTGEAPLLDPAERVRLVAALRDVVPDERWLVAGTGGEATRETIRACRDAAAAGADAALVRPPAYYGPALTPEALARHFRAVADASPIPVIVYNIPVYTHVHLAAALLAALADHPRILGAKDSAGDLKNLAAYRDAVPRWRLFVGAGHLFYAGLELGCDGGLVAMGCFAPREAVELYAAFRAGDRARAGALQERLARLAKEIVGQRGVAGIKAAMNLVGLYGGPVRGPLLDLPPEEREKIAKLIADCGLRIADSARPAHSAFPMPHSAR